MKPLLIIKGKIKWLSSILMIIFGVVVFGVAAKFLIDGASWWWLIGIAFGIFCAYNWTMIIIRGSMTLVFFVKDGYLYFTYDRTKIVANNLEEIQATTFVTNTYNLGLIQRFWRYQVTVNQATTSDFLYFLYNGQQLELADLAYHEVKLTKKQVEEIALFLLGHQPNIQFGKP